MSDFDAIPPDSPTYDAQNPAKPLVLAPGVADTDRWQVFRGGSDPEFITTGQLRDVVTGPLAIALLAVAAPTALTGNAPTGTTGLPILWTDDSLILMS